MPKSILELKADLFGIFQTFAMLDKTYRNGGVPASFYQNKYLSLASELDQLILYFEEKNMDYKEILKELPLDSNPFEILDTIKKIKISDLDRREDKLHTRPLQFAQQTSQITSKFITILDYFQVMETIDIEFLRGLIHELLLLIEPIDLINPIFAEIVSIERELLHFLQTQSLNLQSKKYFEDRFYRTYQSFLAMIQEEKKNP